MLTSPQGGEAVARALAEDDPSSLAAATRLRAAFPAPLAAAALTQAGLRHKAEAKLGARASDFLVTPGGLEQASRWTVAQWRAQEVAATGARRVVDLCCGLGVDAAAFSDAGLEVVAVERDPATAQLATANLQGRVRVVVGEAQSVVPTLANEPDTVVFCDPARRTARGRSWDVADLSPPWPFVEDLLRAAIPAVVKLGPGFPARLIPAAVSARWVSDGGSLVECGLWGGFEPDVRVREAVVLPGEHRLTAVADLPAPAAEAPRVGQCVYEPDPAVIRAGTLGTLAQSLQALPVAPEIAYLVSDSAQLSPFATGFEVLETFAWRPRLLGEWAKVHRVGVLEIKKRGLDLDPADVRRRLRLRGDQSATVIMTPTAQGAVCLVVQRIGDPPRPAWHSA